VVESESRDTLIHLVPEKKSGDFVFKLTKGSYMLYFKGIGYNDLVRSLQIDANSDKQGIALNDDIILSLIELEDTTETALTIPLISKSITEKVEDEPLTENVVVIDTTTIVEQSPQIDSTFSPVPETKTPEEAKTQNQEGGLLVGWLLPLIIISSLGIIIWLILWRRRRKKEANQQP
jgi:hypothetical protein